MKTLKNPLVVFLVIILIVIFIGLSLYAFYKTLTITGEVTLISSLTYIGSTIAGLVGGIVASAFGVELPDDQGAGLTRYGRKTKSLGNLVTSGEISSAEAIKDPKNLKEKLGALYSWVYIVIGILAIIIWLIDDVPAEMVKNLASVSLGLILVIVKNFFS